MKAKLRYLFFSIPTILLLSVILSGCSNSAIAYYSYDSVDSTEDVDVVVIKEDVSEDGEEPKVEEAAEEGSYYSYDLADSTGDADVVVIREYISEDGEKPEAIVEEEGVHYTYESVDSSANVQVEREEY